MPISRDEFNKGIKLSDWAKEIQGFLDGHPGQAFTLIEIFDGMGYQVPREPEKPLKNIFLGALGFWAFGRSLDELVKAKRVERRKIGAEDYYMPTKGGAPPLMDVKTF